MQQVVRYIIDELGTQEFHTRSLRRQSPRQVQGAPSFSHSFAKQTLWWSPGLQSESPRAESRSGSASQAGPVAAAVLQQFASDLVPRERVLNIYSQTCPVQATKELLAFHVRASHPRPCKPRRKNAEHCQQGLGMALAQAASAAGQ